jgi:hypothetical protein
MASELFNTLTGYSVGIPAVTVIDGNGNVVSNFLNLTGNVTANKVYANSFFYANGQPFNANPGGSNTQLQYNNNGALGGIPNVTWNGNNLSLGNVANIKIAGGTNGFVLQTDGSGNLTWTAQTGGNAGNGSPGGANSQVQYNSDGDFGGDAGFTYNDVTNTLNSDNIIVAANVSIGTDITTLGNAYLGNISTTGFASISTLQVGATANLGNVGNVIIIGGNSGQFLTTNGSGNLSWVTVTSPAAGSNTQVQFNDAGTMNGSSSFTFNKSTNTLTATNFVGNGNGLTNVNGSNVVGTVSQAGTAAIAAIAGTVTTAAQPNITSVGNLTSLTMVGTANLGPISNVRISGGISGYYLQTDGAGNLNWAAGGGGGNGSPGGVTTQLQFNNAGVFGGIPNVTFSSGNLSLGNVANVKMTGGSGGYILSTDGSGNLSWIASTGSPGGTNQMVQFNDAGSFGGDTGFTYDSATNILSVPSIKSNTTANFTGATNVNLGSVANLHISGGQNGYVLQTDGSGNLAWSAGGGGGNGTPGGANTQVQFNNDGTFGGSAYFTYNDYTKTMQVGGNLIANSFQIGAGVYKWSTSLVYFATTASSSPAQVLYSIPVADLSGVDFEIIATEPAGPSRQSSKISSLYYSNIVQYTEYASLFVNGGVGNFEVEYNAGNIIVPPSLDLRVTPNSSNAITYKMLITVYSG